MREEIESRSAVIVKTSIVGIIANLFLVTFKAFVGVLSNSIAVILDALNNLSDAVSSIVTIIGSKLSTKKPTKKHPMGYGRIEYMSAMIVSFIVLYAGITAAVSSVRNIFNPKEPKYSVISLVIIGIAVLVKVFLGRFVIVAYPLLRINNDDPFGKLVHNVVFGCSGSIEHFVFDYGDQHECRTYRVSHDHDVKYPGNL